MNNIDKLYSKENIIAHTKDYEEAKKNLKFLIITLKYLLSNIYCYKLYQAVCFMHYKTNFKLLTKLLFYIFKKQTEKTKKLGDKI